MLEEQDSLLHDLTALLAFVDSVSRASVFRGSAAAYTPAGERFLQFICDLAEKTKLHLSQWTISDAADFEDRRGELQTIRSVWKQFHHFIKPTLDADTLHLPYSVIAGINQRIRELPRFEKLDVAVFLTAEPTYIQVYAGFFYEHAEKIRNAIPDAPQFPANLAVIGLPYSQDSTVFPNCHLAHELGHHVGSDINLRGNLESESNAALRIRAGDKYNHADPLTLSAWVDTIANWAEEIFCDLFGALLLGPCFTYAYIEHHDLCSVLDVDGKISADRLEPALAFYKKYPSHYFRIKQQAVILRESDWWGGVKRTKSHLSQLLQQSLEIDDEKHISASAFEGHFVEALIDTLPGIRQLLGDVFSGVDNGWNEYLQLRKAIMSYLQRGVVPSSLVISQKSGNDDQFFIAHPSPLVLLNAGMEFYLTELDSFIRSIPKEKESYDRRLHWVRRVEQWIAKAIEDVSLVKGEA
jgi:hypothetical protein